MLNLICSFVVLIVCVRNMAFCFARRNLIEALCDQVCVAYYECLEQEDQVLAGGRQQGGLSARCSSWSVVVHLRHEWINTLGGSVEA